MNKLLSDQMVKGKPEKINCAMIGLLAFDR